MKKPEFTKKKSQDSDNDDDMMRRGGRVKMAPKTGVTKKAAEFAPGRAGVKKAKAK